MPPAAVSSKRESAKDIIERARAIRAARAIHRGQQPPKRLLESFLSFAQKPKAPGWATHALERFNGGAGIHGQGHNR